MKIEALPDDFIEELIAEPQSVPVGLTCDCGWKLDNGYCRNPDCPWDAPVETFSCEWCGNCEDPEHCVWSVTCPVCSSLPKKLCMEGNKLVGLHQERWDYAGSR